MFSDLGFSNALTITYLN